MRFVGDRLVCSMLVCTVLLASEGAKSAAAASPRVVLGEVTTNDQGNRAELRELRRLVAHELDRLVLPPEGERYVLSTSLVRLQVLRLSKRSEALCEVSGTLRRAEGGALFAILLGRSHVEDTPEAATKARRLALGAAVRSAVRRLPEAVR